MTKHFIMRVKSILQRHLFMFQLNENEFLAVFEIKFELKNLS